MDHQNPSRAARRPHPYRQSPCPPASSDTGAAQLDLPTAANELLALFNKVKKMAKPKGAAKAREYGMTHGMFYNRPAPLCVVERFDNQCSGVNFQG